MPKEGVSIYFTIRDGASQVLSSIGDKTKALDKDTQSLSQAQTALSRANETLTKRQNELKIALEKSQTAIKDARTEYRKLGDEASEHKLQVAIQEQDDLKRALQDVEAQIKGNVKTYNEYRETLRKGSTDSGGGSSGTSSLLAGIGQAGLYDMLGDVAGQWGEILAGSALGSSGGSIASSLLSGAGTGAAIGSMIAPGIGTAVGAALGGLVGTIGGAAQVYADEDEAFKAYYGGLYDTVSAGTSDMIESGSTIAGSREQTQRAFAQRLGSDEAADAYLERVRVMAAGTNYGYDEITGYSKLLLNSYDPESVFGVLQSLSDATAALALSSSDVEVMIQGLSRMRTTDKATQEYLNYFSERGVDVYSALGQALGVDKSQIAGLVTDGAISGTTAAQAILDYIDQEYGGLSEDLMSTYDALADNLEDIMSNLEAAGGEGYNEVRKEGLAAEMEAYEGALGDAVAEINRISGENAAYLENLQEQYTREALSAVLLGSGTTLYGADQASELEQMRQEYTEAAAAYENGSQEAGLKMESLREQAEALATAAYESSDLAIEQQNTELELIAAIRENTVALNWRSDYEKQQELSKGQGLSGVSGWLSGLYDQKLSENQATYDRYKDFYTNYVGSHAAGLQRVPYDNYPALLHEGERVLTANEARAADWGGGTSISISMPGATIREDADLDRLAEALLDKIRLARMAG